MIQDIEEDREDTHGRNFQNMSGSDNNCGIVFEMVENILSTLYYQFITLYYQFISL